MLCVPGRCLLFQREASSPGTFRSNVAEEEGQEETAVAWEVPPWEWGDSPQPALGGRDKDERPGRCRSVPAGSEKRRDMRAGALCHDR